MSDGLITCRRLLAMLVVAAPMLANTAHAQQVVVLVNGEPITALDIEQRGKLTQMSTHKTPARQDVIEELINEKLKVKEAKKWGLEITNSEVEQAYATMASRMRMTTDQLTQTLAQVGRQPDHSQVAHPSRHGLAATRARALPIEPADRGKGHSQAMESKTDDVGHDYTLRPILFIVPPGSPEAFIEGRKREAEALRGRFQGCEEGIAFARALKDVAVRDQVIRSSADMPAELREDAWRASRSDN